MGSLTSSPPVLKSHFESETATVELEWSRASDSRFVKYKIQREFGSHFETVTEIGSDSDTVHVIHNLGADILHRFRVVNVYEVRDNIVSVVSNVSSGIIHKFVDSWQTDPKFIPTRIAIGPNKVAHVLGVGAGSIQRFNKSGTKLSPLVYSTERLACMETSVLDGPSLAIDVDGNIYVVYNLAQNGSRPQPYWSKYSWDGNLLWTKSLDGLFARHILIDGEDVFIETLSQLQHFDRDGNLQTHYLIPALLVSSLRIWDGRFAALIEPISLLDSDWTAPRLVVYDSVDRRRATLLIGRDEKSKADRGSGVLRRPTDFAIDEMNSRVFVVNAAQDRVEVFRDGKYLTQWGSLGTHAGEFRFEGDFEIIDEIETGAVVRRTVVAGGIARDETGYIYVTDPFNDRIQRFHPGLNLLFPL